MADTNETGGEGSDSSELTLTPSARPVVTLYVIIFLVLATLIGYLSTSPRALGDFTVSMRNLLGIALLVLSIGAAIKIYLLKRTRYTINGDHIEYRYSFLSRERRRRLPIQKVRGYELRKGRIESLLGYGTVIFYSGGESGGLGYVQFESVQNPDKACERYNMMR